MNKEYYYSDNNYITRLLKKINKIEKENKNFLKRIEELEDIIYYMPGGKKYNECLEDFEKLQNN